MKGTELLYKMELIAPEYITEAERQGNTSEKKNAHAWKKWCAAAAAVCLIVTGGFALGKMMKPPKIDVLYPSVEVDFAELAESGDTVGVILYCGIAYFQCEYIEPVPEGHFGGYPVIGEYIGKTVSGVEAGANAENYVELASNLVGDVYTLRGYDPRDEEEPRRFICVVDGAGGISICIESVAEYEIGRDFFYDVLRLDEEFWYAEYQLYEEHYSESDASRWLEYEDAAAVKNFISELGDKKFMKTWDIPHDGENSPYDKALGVLTVTKNTGFEIELTIFEGGYVTYNGNSRRAVLVGEDAVSELISAFGVE